jgi:hypothetical protein
MKFQRHGIRVGIASTAEEARTLWLTAPVLRSLESGKMQPAAFAEQIITEPSLPVGSEEFLSETLHPESAGSPGGSRVGGTCPSQLRSGYFVQHQRLAVAEPDGAPWSDWGFLIIISRHTWPARSSRVRKHSKTYWIP